MNTEEQKPKEYPVTNWKEMLDLCREDRKETFLVDLHLALLRYTTIITTVKTLDPSLKDVPNSEIMEFGFNWIDDGKHEHNYTQITNSENGKTVQISRNGDVKDITEV